MSSEAYEIHRERVLYLSEHPLVDRDTADDRAGLERRTRQLTLEEVAK